MGMLIEKFKSLSPVKKILVTAAVVTASVLALFGIATMAANSGGSSQGSSGDWGSGSSTTTKYEDPKTTAERDRQILMALTEVLIFIDRVIQASNDANNAPPHKPDYDASGQKQPPQPPAGTSANDNGSAVNNEPAVQKPERAQDDPLRKYRCVNDPASCKDFNKKAQYKKPADNGAKSTQTYIYRPAVAYR